MQLEKEVLIAGGGITGLTAALSLAELNIRSVIIEQASQLGGFAAQYTCKATDACVKCGACIVAEKIGQVLTNPNIEVYSDSRIAKVDKKAHSYTASIEPSASSDATHKFTCKAQAVIIASGFNPFNPQRLPYGYKKFPDVVTNLELEKMLRRNSVPECPSNGRAPERIAFVQCVGSRDSKLGHLWCSKVCCASALRMSRLIKMRRPQTEIVFFYIDVQTFGKTFQQFYENVQKEVTMIRAIPGDVYGPPEGRLQVVYYDILAEKSREERFDMLVLSVGITPSKENNELANMFGLAMDETGFISSESKSVQKTGVGVFAAGGATGPKSIAESMASADKAALQAASFLRMEVHR
jgi:heterodisulfide reductase subunit A